MRAHCYWNASFDFNLCHVYACLVSRTKLRTNKINFRILIHDMFNHLKLTLSLSCFVSLLLRSRLFTPNITCILSEWKQILCSLIFLPFSSFFYHFNFIVASFRAFPSILWTFDLFHGIRFNRGILNMFLTFFSLIKNKFIEQNYAKTQK